MRLSLCACTSPDLQRDFQVARSACFTLRPLLQDALLSQVWQLAQVCARGRRTGFPILWSVVTCFGVLYFRNGGRYRSRCSYRECRAPRVSYSGCCAFEHRGFRQRKLVRSERKAIVSWYCSHIFDLHASSTELKHLFYRQVVLRHAGRRPSIADQATRFIKAVCPMASSRSA